MEKITRTTDPSMNPDPITHAPGSHPAGTGIGAAAGGAAGIGVAVGMGAAIGTVVGPVGAAVGAAVGAVVGGLAGKAVAEEINPTAGHEYWKKNYVTRPYVEEGMLYEQFGPAYQYGWESRRHFSDKDFADVQAVLSRDWDRSRGKSELEWDKAHPAVRDGWEHARPDNDRP